MPRRDKTGPLGSGPLTGRGLGLCGGGSAFGRGFGRRNRAPLEQVNLTKEEQKKILEVELKGMEEEKKEIEKILKGLK